MKFQATAMAALGALVANPPAAEAARERMSVEEGGIEFNIDYFDDGRSRPYRLSFSDDGVDSTCNFDATGSVTYINAGSEKYRIRYKSNGDLRSVTLTSSRRRNLAAEKLDEERAVTEGSVVGISRQTARKLYACEDCVATWDVVCDSGVPSVCALVDHGSPILSEGEATIATICENLSAACSSSGGEEACEGQCEDDDDGGDDDDNDDDDIVSPCLDPLNPRFRCIYDATGVVPNLLNLASCELDISDAARLPTCFETFGKTNIHTLAISMDGDFTTLPAGVFMGLSNLADLGISYTSLNYLPDGVFAGLSALTNLEIRYSSLTSLPEGIFSDTPNLQNLAVTVNQLASLPAGLFESLSDLTSLAITYNQLTSLPAGLFEPLSALTSLDMQTTSALQCIPPSTATDVLVTDGFVAGNDCECEPAVAITCDVGTCQPGSEGYTCG